MPEEAKQSFECGTCCEERPQEEHLFIGNDRDSICKECFDDYIVPKFQEAIKFEAEYDNARYSERPGEGHLNARDYVDILGTDFVREYEEKEAEYNTMLEDRVYCRRLAAAQPGFVVIHSPAAEDESLVEALDAVKINETKDSAVPQPRQTCGAFIGSKVTLPQGSGISCSKCSGCVCAKCGEAYGVNHVCGEPEVQEDPFKNMTRGVDYQRCPHCNTGTMLLDGCNYLRCRGPGCGKGFCFLCGEQTNHDSKHWQSGNAKGCTKFGTRESGLFDADVGDDNKVKCAVLELPLLKQHLLEVLTEEYGTPLAAGWVHDPSLTDEWVVVCRYLSGPAYEPFEQAIVMWTLPKIGTELTLERHEVTQMMQIYFSTFPERLRQTLIAYSAVEELREIDIDEAESLVDVNRDITINKLQLARNKEPWWKKVQFDYFLWSMEKVLRTSRSTSLEASFPWTAQLPPSSSIYYEHPEIIRLSFMGPRAFEEGEKAILHALSVSSPFTETESAVIARFEKLLLADTVLFDACVLEMDRCPRGSNIDRPAPVYEKAVQYCE